MKPTTKTMTVRLKCNHRIEVDARRRGRKRFRCYQCVRKQTYFVGKTTLNRERRVKQHGMMAVLRWIAGRR